MVRTAAKHYKCTREWNSLLTLCPLLLCLGHEPVGLVGAAPVVNEFYVSFAEQHAEQHVVRQWLIDQWSTWSSWPTVGDSEEGATSPLAPLAKSNPSLLQLKI